MVNPVPRFRIYVGKMNDSFGAGTAVYSMSRDGLFEGVQRMTGSYRKWLANRPDGILDSAVNRLYRILPYPKA